MEGLHRQGTERDTRPVPDYMWVEGNSVDRVKELPVERLKVSLEVWEQRKELVVPWNPAFCPALSPRISAYGPGNLHLPAERPDLPGSKSHLSEELRAALLNGPNRPNCPVPPRPVRRSATFLWEVLCLWMIIWYFGCSEGCTAKDVLALGLASLGNWMHFAVQRSVLQVQAVCATHFHLSNLKIALFPLLLCIYLPFSSELSLATSYFSSQPSEYVPTVQTKADFPYELPNIAPFNSDFSVLQIETSECTLIFPFVEPIYADLLNSFYKASLQTVYLTSSTTRFTVTIDSNYLQAKTVQPAKQFNMIEKRATAVSSYSHRVITASTNKIPWTVQFEGKKQVQIDPHYKEFQITPDTGLETRKKILNAAIKKASSDLGVHGTVPDVRPAETAVASHSEKSLSKDTVPTVLPSAPESQLPLDLKRPSTVETGPDASAVKDGHEGEKDSGKAADAREKEENAEEDTALEGKSPENDLGKATKQKQTQTNEQNEGKT